MAERDSKSPQLQIQQFAGLNERLSRANLPPGTLERLEGLYPAKTGLLERIPTHRLLRQLSGNPTILNIYQTHDRYGNILVQTETDLQMFTLDQLLNRNTVPDLSFPALNEEETMALAILTYEVASSTTAATTNGGPLKISGGAANAFYGLPINTKRVDTTGFCSLTAGTKGVVATTNPVEGKFRLTAGTYRIEAEVAAGIANSTTVTVGLYNITQTRFEYYDNGGTDPIIGTTSNNSGSTETNCFVKLNAQFVVSSGTDDYGIRMAHSTTTHLGQTQCLGLGNVVAGAPANNVFAIIKLLKVS